MDIVIYSTIWALSSLFIYLVFDAWAYVTGQHAWYRVMFSFLLTCSQIVMSEFILGLFSLITRPYLLICNLLFSVFLLWLLCSSFRKENPLSTYCSSLISQLRTLPKHLRMLPSTIGWINIALSGLAAGVIAWVVFIGLLFPVIDWDGNSYHMTFIGNVIQHHNFFDAPTSIPWLIGYPKAGEFIQLWNVILPGHDSFVDLSQLPFIVLAVGALYTIARNLNVSKKSALFASLTFIFTPIILNELKTTYVDIMLSSLFFTIFALVTKKALARIDYLLIGIMYSLIIGIKATGLILVLVTIPFVTLHLLKTQHSWKRLGWKSSWSKLLLLSFPSFFGLYWYIKNLILFGSPIYPFGFKVMGHTLFPGKTFQEYAADAVSAPENLLPHNALARIWFVWTEQEKWSGCLYNYDSNYSGLGPIWLIILLPALVGAVYIIIKKRMMLFAGTLLAVAIAYAVYPANFYPRYTFFILLAAIPAFGLVLDHCKDWSRRLLKLLTIMLAAFTFFTTYTLCYFPPQAIADEVKSYRDGASHGLMYKSLPGNAFIVAQELSKEGDTIAYDSKPYFIYPLWRRDFKNNVTYIPLTEPRIWKEQLLKEGVDYVFTFKNSPENKAAHTLQLKKVYEDADYEIFTAK